MKRSLLLPVLLTAIFLLFPAQSARAQEFSATIKKFPYRLADLTVVGAPTWHTTKQKDTFVDLARFYGLGFNEVDLLYPQVDVWIPPEGKTIQFPTLWVLPPTQHEQLVINIPEMRLYFFDKASSTVQTYPIGVGDEGWESPLGTWSITEKRPNPVWYIPASLQAKYGMTSMPPGPENPLGEFVMKFSAGAYGIHGTAMPWGVGRLVSHGCIRCYPEHISLLYPQVPVGTKLEVLYEPIKFGQKDGQIYVEVHPDVYLKFPDFNQYAMEKLAKHPQASLIDQRKYQMAVRLQNGVPINVSRIPSDDARTRVVELLD